MQLLRKTFFVFALFFLIAPLSASAHLKWFVDEDHHEHFDFDDSLGALYTVTWLAIALIIVTIGVFLERHLPSLPKNTLYRINHLKPFAYSLFSMWVGLFLVIASYKGFVFSQNLNNFGPIHSGLLFLQALIGLYFIFGIAERVFSIILIFFGAFIFLYLGAINAIEASWVMGVSLFILIVGRPKFRFTKDWHIPNYLFRFHEEYAIPFLRIFAGFDLLFLGFSEKLLNPELGMIFLQQYHWNFMHDVFGISWYSDYLFVLSAGAVEVILGTIFLLGIVTRLNALAAGIIFTLPLFFLNSLTEVIGHMPHFAIVIMLLLFGSGEKFKIVKGKESQHYTN